MPLEATMMIIDNSEYMRNGDYPPTRFEAQTDAINTVFQTKTDANPENSVGIMTMAGKGPEVLVTHTRDQGQILSGAHTASRKLAGQADLITAINVAQLALKHRQNKNLRQRIILFVGSPLEGEDISEDNLVKIARKLKKNNVAVDVICFGDGIEDRETPFMKVLIDNANSGDNSHLVVVPPDSRRLLSDALISSPILSADRSASIPEAIMTDSTGGGTGGEFDFDPNMDPELAMALRMSLEEENARRAAASGTASSAPNLESIAETSSAATPSSSSTQPPPAPVISIPADSIDDEEAALLQQAISMSQGNDEDVEMADHDAPKAADTTTAAAAVSSSADMDEDMDEDEAIARAIAMSMEQEEQGKK